MNKPTLTEAEQRVFNVILPHKSTRSMAKELDMSVPGVNSQLVKIFKKFGVSGKKELWDKLFFDSYEINNVEFSEECGFYDVLVFSGRGETLVFKSLSRAAKYFACRTDIIRRGIRQKFFRGYKVVVVKGS